MCERLVTIATFLQPTEAYVAKGLLEAQGIVCYMQDEAVAQTLLVSPVIGGAKLQVAASDVESAAQILAGDEAASAEASVESAPACPECGSLNATRADASFFATLLLCLALVVPCPNLKRRWRCSKCGHKWKD